jgi:hypothetical protein
MHQQERLSTYTEQLRTSQATIDAMRFLSARTLARGGTDAAIAYMRERDGWQKSADAMRRKAAVPAGDTVTPAWAGALATPPQIDPVTATVQRDTLIDRVKGFRRVPFHAPVPIETAGAAFGWIGQGQVKPITRLTYDDVTLPSGKVSGIVVLTKELVRLTADGAEQTMFDTLTGGIVAFLDAQFLDPAVAEIANIRPASITNGVAPVTATGDLVKDVAAVLAALFASRPGAALPTLILSPAHAIALALAGASLQLPVNGGADVLAIYTTTGAGQHIVAVDAAAVVFADGPIDLDTSEDATVQMDSAPDNPATAATILTSLWQTDRVGFKVERLSWYHAVDGAVQFCTVAPPAAATASTARKAGAK